MVFFCLFLVPLTHVIIYGDNEAPLYLIQAKIEKFKQDYETSISNDITEFTNLKSEFLNKGGYTDKNHLGWCLPKSLHSTPIRSLKYSRKHETNN